MRGRALTCAAAAAIAVAAPAWAATAVVPVGDNYFGHHGGVHDEGAATHEVSVKRGGLVRWIWVGTATHNVTVTSGPERFHSPSQSSGSYSRRLRKRGTYRIVCTIHRRSGQTMTLRVR